MSYGHKGQLSQDNYNKRWSKIKTGKASQVIRWYSVDEAIRKAGL
jgi:hypothetical protein